MEVVSQGQLDRSSIGKVQTTTLYCFSFKLQENIVPHTHFSVRLLIKTA